MPSFSRIVKEIIDQSLGWMVLIVLSPLFWLIAGLIRLETPGPVFFRQERIGRDGHPFVAYKFRSMVDNAASMGLGLNVASDDSRITRTGKFLRNTSLDELPELINVLRGEMSLVGPRPLLIQYLPRYSKEQARRHDVLPGMAGWAQVNGRNAISWEEKFRLDVWYVDHWNLRLDIKILLMTFGKVLRREGISAPGEATAREFMGSVDEDKRR